MIDDRCEWEDSRDRCVPRLGKSSVCSENCPRSGMVLEPEA